MTVAAGTRLGPYEALSQPGKGDPGDIYCTRDTTLHRHVALKIMPVQVAVSGPRVAVHVGGESDREPDEPNRARRNHGIAAFI